MARGATGVLVSVAKGVGMMGVPRTRKPGLVQTLLDATGCRMEIERGRRVVLRDGVAIPSDHDVPADLVAESIRTWLREGTAVMEASRAAIPNGGMEIAQRMGLSVPRALLLLEAIHYVVVVDDGRMLEMSRSNQGINVEYRHPAGVRWRNGLVTMRHRTLPGSMALALRGRPLSMVMDDAVLGDRLIRKVCDVASKEGVMRIVTMDEGRRSVTGD